MIACKSEPANSDHEDGLTSPSAVSVLSEINTMIAAKSEPAGSNTLLLECQQRGTDVVNLFFTLYGPQSTTTVEILDKLKSDALEVKKQTLLIPRELIETNAFALQIPGMVDCILGHLSLKSESESIRKTIHASYTLRSCVVLTPKCKLSDGKLQSGAFRVVWPLRRVAAAFTKSMTHTIPVLDDLSKDHIDKTMTPQDVLKVDMAEHMLWMHGDRYPQFVNRFVTDLWYMQAIELNPPKLGDDSERYQFQNCRVDKWPDTINEFMSGLKTVSRDVFARITSGYEPGVPYAVQSFDDMPVAARIPKNTQTSN